MSVAAIISMLHEPPAPRDSASRLFKGEPVLSWTLARLARSHRVAMAAVLCWQDQLDAVKPVADEAGACVLVKSPRMAIPQLDSLNAAQRWSSGWRGGLLGTCCFDRGFYAPYLAEALENLRAGDSPLEESSHVLVVDPSAGLVDPELTDALVSHAQARPDLDVVFTQAAPGLSGVILRQNLLIRLAKAKSYPGRLLNYWPDSPGRDPITTEACMPVPAAIARTLLRFTLDSDRQIRRLTAATADLNGQLISTDAQRLLAIVDHLPPDDPLPRDLTLEINTTRATRPIYWPGAHLAIERRDIPAHLARRIVEQAAHADDLRLSLAGVGDPLLHPHVREIVDCARSAGIRAIHLDTDLLDVSEETIAWLANSGVDVVSVHIPAATPKTYQQIMGVDRLDDVIRNLAALVKQRGGLPIFVPTFIKCAQNLDEMEPWYDHYLRILGAAVIAGPSDFAGQVPDVSCADMSPPRRRPCWRLDSRMTVLSSGMAVSCEEDVRARQVMGDVAKDELSQIWRKHFGSMRAEHAAMNFDSRPLCMNCRQWHRP